MSRHLEREEASEVVEEAGIWNPSTPSLNPKNAHWLCELEQVNRPLHFYVKCTGAGNPYVFPAGFLVGNHINELC